MASQVSRRLRTKEAAEYLGLAESTLEKDRVLCQIGIPYIKLGRTVVYDTAVLDEVLAARRCRSTSEPKP